MNRFHALLASAALLAAPAVASAQMATTSSTGQGMYTAEAYLAKYTGDVEEGGFGARVMVGAPFKSVLSLFSRPAVGGFVTYTSQDNFSTLHVGGQIDARIFGSPINGYVDPFVSLGAGLFRTKIDLGNINLGSGVVGSASGTSNNFALSPAIGSNFTIQKGMSIGIRGDIRDVIIFDSGNTANSVVFEGGLSFTF